MDEKKIVSSAYDFSEDAMGLGDFIRQEMDEIGDDCSPVVYVRDNEGRAAVKANWETRTLTDGSKVCELILIFEDHKGWDDNL